MSLKRPDAGETFATGMVRPKTTALFFDRLWVHPALIEYRSVEDLSPYAVPAELIPGYVTRSSVGRSSASLYAVSNVQQAIQARSIMISGHQFNAGKDFGLTQTQNSSSDNQEDAAKNVNQQIDKNYVTAMMDNRGPIDVGPGEISSKQTISPDEKAVLQYMLRENNLSDSEREIISAMVEASEDIKDASEFSWTDQSANVEEAQYRDDHGAQPVKYKTTSTGFRTTVHRNRALRDIVKLYAREGIELTPVYHDPTEYDALQPDFQQTQEGIEVSLDFVPVAMEDGLSWEQVLEFRRDTEAREKLGRMRRWFTLELQDKSEAEIRATLEEKLDDYSWALRKHGIQTTVGGFTSFLAAAAAPTTLSLLAASPLAVTGGGIVLAAGAVAWLANKQIERTELHRSEIAYLHEVRKLVA
jgi:hypothetical protein